MILIQAEPLKKLTLQGKTDGNVRDSTPIRIGLLTPYGGTNLGDGAIQKSTIEGLQRRIPGAILWGITLNPNETSKRHGIRAFPITGLLISFYSETLFGAINGFSIRFSNDSKCLRIEENNTQKQSRTYDLGYIWRSLKQIPFLGNILKNFLGFLRKGFIIIHEIRHIFFSFRFVKKLDMLIVSGGGQLDETWGRAWGHPYVLFRWAVLAKLAGKQFVVVSVGVDKVTTRLSKFFIRTALSLASYRSFRDKKSKRLLENWAFTRNDACIPDLAFGLKIKLEPPPDFSKDRPLIVGISPMAFGRDGSWPETATTVYRRYLSYLSEFVISLLKKGHSIVLFKSSGIDRLAIEDLLVCIKQLRSDDVFDMISTPIVETVDELFEEVNKLDFVIATRLHGVILSHIIGKPVLAVSYDRKVTTHMQDIGQEKYVLDLKSFNSFELSSLFQDMVNNSDEIQNKIIDQVHVFRNSVENQFEHLSKLLDTIRISK